MMYDVSDRVLDIHIDRVLLRELQLGHAALSERGLDFLGSQLGRNQTAEQMC